MMKTLVAFVAALIVALPALPQDAPAPPHPERPIIQDGRCDREQLGRIIGGAAGAAIGSQIGDGTERRIAMVGGAVIGAIVGGHIGRSMDEADRACVAHVLEAGRTGTRVAWHGGSGDRFVVTPTRDYRNGRGERCREYVAGDVQQPARGAACRQADGTWRTAAR